MFEALGHLRARALVLVLEVAEDVAAVLERRADAAGGRAEAARADPGLARRRGPPRAFALDPPAEPLDAPADLRRLARLGRQQLERAAPRARGVGERARLLRFVRLAREPRELRRVYEPAARRAREQLRRELAPAARAAGRRRPSCERIRFDAQVTLGGAAASTR